MVEKESIRLRYNYFHNRMQNALEKVADLQIAHSKLIVAASLVLTLVLATGIPEIRLQTDFQDSLPDDIEAIQAQDKVESNFGSSDSIIVLFEVNDRRKQENFVTDIRDPRVLRTLIFLEEGLEKEGIIDSTNSMASLFDSQPGSKTGVKKILQSSGASFTNRDYTATTMFVKLSGEMTEENIREANQAVKEEIEDSPKYPGLEVTLTGTPVVRTTLSNVLVTDSVTTISAASALILGLLIIVRGRAYGPITFVPLFLGLVWALGFMGHFGIPLSFATISLGSMILGLGVEYGSFITERLLEEMEQHSVEESIRITVPNTGKAVLGSAATDGVGFMALLLASFAFIRDLGVTLALGELLTVSSAVLVTPCLVIEYRRWKS